MSFCVIVPNFFEITPLLNFTKSVIVGPSGLVWQSRPTYQICGANIIIDHQRAPESPKFKMVVAAILNL